MTSPFKFLRLLVAIIFPIAIVAFGGCKNTEHQNNDNSNLRLNTANVFTEDGAWCWFSDPRAIYYDENLVITGWIKKDGSVEVASLDLNSREKKFNNIYPQMEVDDHDNPAFTILPNGNVFTMFAWHSTKKGVIFNQTLNGPDVKSFGEN
ncbi:MAG: BNR-4 repeat-containing protein, partial [Mariniphaga sp.]|nr:BNR-4 repeat-containing protein [Mariniphaga sp.]